MKNRLGFFICMLLSLLSSKVLAQGDFYVSPVSQCYSVTNNAQAAISVTVPSATSYSWSVLGTPCTTVTPAVSNGSIVNIAFSCCGSFTINCTAFAGAVPISGAVQSHTTFVQCPTFTAGFSAMQTASQGINFINTSSGTPTMPVYHSWKFGDNTTSILLNPSHTYPSIGIYTVTLTDSSAIAPFCTSKFTNTVSVCYAGFTVPVTPIYQGSPVTFTGSGAPTTGTTSYYWYTPAQGSTLATTAVTYTSSGPQTVTFGYSQAAPFCSVAATQTINVLNPCTTITYTQGALGSVTLTAPAGAGTSYTWSSGSTGPTIVQTFSTNGLQTFSLSASGGTCGTVNTAITITITSVTQTCNILPNFSVTQAPGSAGVASLTSSSTGTTTGTTFHWDFGDNTTAGPLNTPTVTHIYPANGTYVATLTVDNHNPSPTCFTTVTKTITVTSFTNQCTLPGNTAFTYTQGANGVVQFINMSSGISAGASYTWAFGAGQGTSGVASPTYAFPANGAYNVTLTIRNTTFPTCTASVAKLVSVSNVPCNLSASFTFTQGLNGFVNFFNTSTGTTSATTYTLNFGDGSSAVNSFMPHTYLTNGVFTVTLQATNGSTCGSTTVVNLTITNAPCTMTVGFSAVMGAGGLVNFTNTSIGATSYTWNFGNGNVAMVASPPALTYTNMGPYIVALAANNGFCTITHTQMISPCTQSVSFTYTQGANGLVNFMSTSTGTYSNSIYTWYFGDGQTGTGPNPVHTYSANGTYYDSLLVVNSASQTCYYNRARDTLVINSIPGPCTLSASFSHTLNLGGYALFTNQSTGSTTQSCFWNFGDGYYSTGLNPTHTYTNSGMHYVKLTVSAPGCPSDSTMTALNVTGVPCSANSSFTLLPTTTPQYWSAIPAYPWNVVSALWSWGDGNTSPTLYASHVYSVAGNYNICLTVSVSCGATASTCSSYSVFKSAGNQVMDVISVNVLPPTLILTGVNEAKNSEGRYSIYPNPNKGSFDLEVDGLSGASARVVVYDLVGRAVYNEQKEIENGELRTNMKLDGLNNGVYFVSINSENKLLTKKIVVNK